MAAVVQVGHVQLLVQLVEDSLQALSHLSRNPAICHPAVGKFAFLTYISYCLRKNKTTNNHVV